MEVLFNIGIAVLGILLFTLVLAQKHIRNKTFKGETFIADNIVQWLWSLVAVIVIAASIAIAPELQDPIKATIGLDVGASKGAYFLLGFGLSSIIRPSTK